MENNIKSMTPKQIVGELDKYIIGQDEAKKSVAIALRNRYRRSLLDEKMREEITPKNILMMGPTGVGKTEIARRLAKIMDAPFVKVEATKFTEVGYVGRDVDSMIRDLVEASVRLSKQVRVDENREAAAKVAEELIVKAMIPGKEKSQTSVGNIFDNLLGNAPYKTQKQEYEEKQREKAQSSQEATETEMARDQVRRELREGRLEKQIVEIEVDDNPKLNQLDMQNEGMSIAIGNIFDNMMPKKTKKRKVKVSDARRILTEQEAQKMVDMDLVIDEALENAEQNGIVFIDEIDKIASSSSMRSGADVSREGVQRDILPIVEGCNVNTKFGVINTTHILFIAAGAFSVSAPSDLIPELQGRFPLRVELESLGCEDFKRILKEPKNSLIMQYSALLGTENVTLDITEDAIERMSVIAEEVNSKAENIGARRLHTIMEKVLDEINFSADEHAGETIRIDADYVNRSLGDIVQSQDLSRYIL